MKFLRVDYESIERQLKAAYAINEKMVAEAALKKLVETTPVDTGLARDSWKLTKKNRRFSIKNSV